MQLGTFGSGQQKPQGTVPGYSRIKIDHNLGRFTIPDLPSIELGREISILGLGLIRSRMYWVRETGGGSSARPACKSHDAVVGLPTQLFPWDESEFANVSSNSQVSCEKCTFKGFLHGENQPRCKQTWTIPCMLCSLNLGSYNRLIRDQVFTIDFTASSIPALTEYLTPFRDSGVPLYARHTLVKLKRVSKGDRNFTKAEFENIGTTDQKNHPRYSELLNQVREFMQPKDEGKPFIPLSMGQPKMPHASQAAFPVIGQSTQKLFTPGII